ncbi:MAG TPA: hypothetical protein VFJ07_21760 [Streptosporangiaceae bacterium]|nr:hypothetical protein [Streptosporangiaceae bacterium]
MDGRPWLLGRPDLPHDYDDGRLVDVNQVPGDVLVSCWGLTGAESAAVVAARDQLGRFSSPEELSLFQENASAVTYSAGWTRQTLSGANGGSVDFATVAGKTATLTFTGFQAAWMSTQGPARGSATVKLDSGTAATISTNASSPKTAQIVDVVTAAANGSHKLVVTVLGTPGHPRIDVDAFVVLSATS